MHKVKEKEEIKEVPNSETDDAVVEMLKNYIRMSYEPATLQDMDFHYSTAQVYEMLFKLYPNAIAFSAANVTQWLFDLGYRFEDFGQMRFEWLFKKVQPNY